MRKKTKKEKIDLEQERYRLWFEYLKRNKNYKEFCEIIQEKKKNPSYPIPQKFKTNSVKHIANYHIFGDIHSKQMTFKKWWEINKNVFLQNDISIESYISRRLFGITEELKLKKIVEDYSEYIQSDIDHCIMQYKFYNKGQEPTLNDMRNIFFKELKERQLSEYITLRIDPRGKTTEDILKEVKKHIREKRKRSQIKKREFNFIRFLKPSTKLRLDELQKYLNVYDLKQQKLKPEEIIKRINPNDDVDDEDTQRAYRDFNQKAKKIISFVERGIFPGQYDETNINRKKRNAKKQ